MKSTSISPSFICSPLSALPSTLLPKLNTVNGFLCMPPDTFHKYINIYKYIKKHMCVFVCI